MLGLTVVQGIGRRSLMVVKVKQTYVVKRSRYQEIVIAEVEEFGKSLILDGYLQSSIADEFIYHECLVHPALLTHPAPRRVLIVGGGEGATLREVLKHPSVEKVTMVDIDEDVVKLSSEFLPEMHGGSFSDPRAEIVIEDGKEYIRRTTNKFDVVILDLTDPYSSDIAKELYTKEFYERIRDALGDDGIMVTQAGSRFFFRELYDTIAEAVRGVYRHVLEYQAWIPSFGYACNFLMGSKLYDPRTLSAEFIDKRISERGLRLRFLDGKRIRALMDMGVY